MIIPNVFLSASTLSNVFSSVFFTQIEDITSRNAIVPYNRWSASLGWSLLGLTAKKGSTFTLTMPAVSQVEGSIALISGSTTYATCVGSDGSLVVPYSTLKCTITTTVPLFKLISGTTTAWFVFAAGGSASAVDLANAVVYKEGLNQITWSQTGSTTLKANVTFQAGAQIQTNTVTFSQRVVQQTYRQTYALSHDCGSFSTTQGLTAYAVTDNSVMCSNVAAWISNDFNAWGMPMSAIAFANATIVCSPSEVTVRYTDLPAGYRLFLTGAFKLSAVASVMDIYTGFVCANGDSSTVKNRLSLPAIAQNPAANGVEAVVDTTKTAGSVTAVATAPLSQGTRTVTVSVPTTKAKGKN